jgi:hypothetical protein
VKRSGWITGVVVAQFLCGGLFLGTSVILFFLMRQPAVSEGVTAPGPPSQGLRLALAILAPLATAVFVGAWGLAKGHLWGWWLAFLIDVGLFVILLIGMIGDGLGSMDWDLFSFAAVALVLAGGLLVPSVREFYWSGPKRAAGVSR